MAADRLRNGADFDELKARLSEAEKKIIHYDRLIWAAGAVIAFFGISGIVLKKEIATLEQKVEDLDKLADTAKLEIDDHRAKALAAFDEAARASHDERMTQLPTIDLKVKSIEVVNSEDETLVYMGEGNEGDGLLKVLKPNAKELFEVTSDTAAIAGDVGSLKMGLYSDTNEPYLKISEGGTSQVEIDYDSDGGMVITRNKQGKTASMMAVESDGSGLLQD